MVGYDYFDFIQEPTRNESIAVGLTSKEVASTRTGSERPRKSIVIRNISPNAADTITVNIGYGAAVANTGIVLRQYESFTDANDAGYICWQGVITAICATANGVLAVFER